MTALKKILTLNTAKHFQHYLSNQTFWQIIPIFNPNVVLDNLITIYLLIFKHNLDEIVIIIL